VQSSGLSSCTRLVISRGTAPVLGEKARIVKRALPITHNPHLAVDIGECTEELVARLSDESFAKYPQYGRLEPTVYMGGVSVLRLRRVLAWTSFTENATRFRFE
jgi:hypothetical protein